MLTDKQWDRMSFQMYVIYEKIPLADGRLVFVPHVDVHGHAVAYASRAAAKTDLWNLRHYRRRNHVRLIKVGPIS